MLTNYVSAQARDMIKALSLTSGTVRMLDQNSQRSCVKDADYDANIEFYMNHVVSPPFQVARSFTLSYAVLLALMLPIECPHRSPS